ncbi:MAG: hypothetical protein ACM3IH_00185, partial [Sphingobacteriales bacterium]
MIKSASSHLALHQRGGVGNIALLLEYYVTPGHWSFCSEVVVGWIGAWGSPVFGCWPHRIPNLHYGDVWYIPAIL